MNKIQLIGRLTKDPEVRTTKNGKACCSFTLAVDRRYKPEGEDKPKADFILCIAWGSTAEFMGKNFEKGVRIGLAGHLEAHTWDKDGKRFYSQEVCADELYFADAPRTDARELEKTSETQSDEEDPMLALFAPIPGE